MGNLSRLRVGALLAIAATVGLALAAHGLPALTYDDGCYVKEYVAAASPSCPGCVTGYWGCPDASLSWHAFYYKCALAAPGEDGKTVCVEQSQWISTYYTCETDWDTSHFITCGAAEVGAAAACAACLLEPTKLTCIACGATLVGTVAGCTDECDFVDECVRDMDSAQDTVRNVFTGFQGTDCTGDGEC